jgi:hypothetical protein
VADFFSSHHVPTLPYRSARPFCVPTAWRSDQAPTTERGNLGGRTGGAWSRSSCAGCLGGPTPPRSLAFRRPPTSLPVVVALPHSSSSASCTSPLLGVSHLHFPAPWCALRIVPSTIQFCSQRHRLCLLLSPVLPTMRFGVGLAPSDSRSGPGGLCSMRPPPAGHADLDVDANYTVLTP